MISFPSWLAESGARIDSMVAAGQFPHGLLILGRAGTGRRMLALSAASRILGCEDVDLGCGLGPEGGFDLEALPAHPDLKVIQPEFDKRTTISVEQIRQSGEFLGLTSHQRGSKVLIVTPAQAMTTAAANSLLKTLEEPPGDSALILISDSLSRLPATVVSRCHRMRVAPPGDAAGVDWLNDCHPGTDWSPLLEMAGGAPVTAIHIRDAGFDKHVQAFQKDLRHLRAGQTSPVAVAGRWAKVDQVLCLNWLYRQLSSEIRAAKFGSMDNSNANPRNRDLQKSGENLNIERRFAELKDIGDLLRRNGSGLNRELQLANVLMHWFG